MNLKYWNGGLQWVESRNIPEIVSSSSRVAWEKLFGVISWNNKSSLVSSWCYQHNFFIQGKIKKGEKTIQELKRSILKKYRISYEKEFWLLRWHAERFETFLP